MMLNKICFYHNKIFVADDACVTAYSYKKNSKSKDRKFQECFKFKVPLNNDFVKDMRMSVVDNYVAGFKCLIILVIDEEGVYRAFNFCNIFSKQIYAISLPRWYVSDANIYTNIFVSDGPTFIYRSNSAFHFYSVPYNIHKDFEYKFLCSDMTDFRVLQFKSFGPFNDKSSQHILSIVAISFNILTQQCLKFFGFISEKNNSTVKYENLQINLFFPASYELILKAVQVIKCISQFNPKSVNVQLKESSSVICTENECLIFENAILKYCCKLPHSLMDTMFIKVELGDIFFNLKNLLIAFENKMVFFIKVLKNINCQVVKHWNNIEIALTGDILEKGSKQVLLLSQTDRNSWEHNSILYDMQSLIPIDTLCNSVMPDKCLKTTLSGLEKKVQAGLSATKQIELEISKKSTATIYALAKLNELKIETEYLESCNIFQESLVDLILFKDENIADNKLLECEPSVKLLDRKQRYTNNQWIISMFFINDGERSICNPSIKLLIKDNEIASTQKLFICYPDDYFLCGKYSRQIEPKIKFYLVISTEFLILPEQEEIIIILTWYDGSENAFSNEIFVNEENKAMIQHQLCTEIKISVDDVLKHQWKKDISSLDDLLFFQASQQRIGLSILSLHSNINELENMMMNIKLDSFDLHLFESTSKSCMCNNDEKSLLFGTHFLLQNCKQNMAEIDAFVRNEKDICLLIHFLYQKLPEDTVIFPCQHFKEECLQRIKNVVISMKSEIDLLISSLNIHNISDALRKNYQKLMSSHEVGMISISKATYQRIRIVLVKKECYTDSIFKTMPFTCVS